MKHYLMRHAEAQFSLGLPDSARPLTPEGREHAYRVGQKLLHLQLAPQKIVHSGFRRAHETAIQVNGSFSVPMETFSGLSPEGNPEDICDFLALAEESILLVSHLPLVERICHELSGSSPSFAPGTLVELEIHNPYGKGNKIRVIAGAKMNQAM